MGLGLRALDFEYIGAKVLGGLEGNVKTWVSVFSFVLHATKKCNRGRGEVLKSSYWMCTIP